MHRSIRSYLITPATLVVLCTCAALLPQAGAVTPAPDGGYPNGNTAEGQDALLNLTSGSFNTAVGSQALNFVGPASNNTAVGVSTLFWNGADNNTAVGASAMFQNTAGTANTAVGFEALTNNIQGNDNTATGAQALHENGTGRGNTAAGVSALFNNTTGNDNTATGISALQKNNGSYNTASGASALSENTSGYDNTATGLNAMFFNSTGHDNTADGLNALLNNTSGSNNVAFGKYAGYNLTTGSNNIDIGANVLGKSGEANTTRIGKQGTQNATFVAGIYNVPEPVAGGIKPVYINSNGQLGTTPPASSARFKEAIKPMDKASEAILGLKPVSFRYKNDEEATAQFGLIAEEVAKVNPDLVIRDDKGDSYTVRYEVVNAMLLNEFLKEHRRVQELEMNMGWQQNQFESALAKQEKTIAQQQKQIEALIATVRKVSDRIELSASATQMAANDD